MKKLKIVEAKSEKKASSPTLRDFYKRLVAKYSEALKKLAEN